jgi:hypothetical protein
MARLGLPHDPLVAALRLLKVGQQQLGLDRLDVASRVDVALGVRHALVAVGPDHMDDRIRLADVGQELVAEPFAPRGAANEAGDVVEGDGLRYDRRGGDGLGHALEPLVGHGYDGHVGLHGRERIVRGRGACARKRIEERRLAGVRQADDADPHRSASASCRRRVARAMTAPRTTPATVSEGKWTPM